MAAMVAAQSLLVPRGTERGLALSFFELEETVLDEVLLANFIEGEHCW
jgi:hypothetical protein